jgi:peptidoglycan/LPS O-acetylase OafA/YrhL
MNRIHSLESLRGLLALWVVIGHTIKHAGYSEQGLGPFKLLAMPNLAVDVFIILSGFVIFFLLDNQRVSTTQFIVKRWFRLAPLLLALLLVSALTLEAQFNVIAASPFPNKAISEDLQIHADSIAHLGPQLLAHVTMLHGMVPDALLKNSQFGIIGQAWSISLEWQFYLLAPLLFGLLAKRRWYWLCAAIAAFCVLRAVNFANDGLIVNQAHYFIIGILSYYGWKHCKALTIEAGALDALAMAAIALIYLLLSRTASLIIWVALMALIVGERRALLSAPQRVLAALLQSPLMRWLGEISYSVYLTHMLVLYAVQHALHTLAPGLSQPAFLAAMLLGVVSATIALSALTYRFIEQPGIAAGRKALAWFGAWGAARAV